MQQVHLPRQLPQSTQATQRLASISFTAGVVQQSATYARSLNCVQICDRGKPTCSTATGSAWEHRPKVSTTVSYACSR